MPERDPIARTFLRWTCLRAACHRGYVLTSSLWFVLDAHLSASGIVGLGLVYAVTLVVADVPAGAWSDALSRKWPLVVGHGFLAVGMVATGLVTSYPLLVLTQVLWGLGWACSGGADVAWLSDELARPDRVARVLTARERWDLTGGAVGIVAFGGLGRLAGPTVAIALSGLGVAALGVLVAARFPEDRFVRGPVTSWRTPWRIARAGARVARRDRGVRLVLAATLLVAGGGQISWLFPKRLVALGLPGDTVLWYTALGVVAYGLGAAVLRVVEARIGGGDGADRVAADGGTRDRGVADGGERAARRAYALGCLAGAAGLGLLAIAPAAVVGSAGVLLVRSASEPVIRATGTVWVNARTGSAVRATVHSFLTQAGAAGGIAGGIASATLAASAGVPATIAAAAGSLALAGVLVAVRGHQNPERRPRPLPE